jgi:tetrahydromethanopterin S-methyltransferase subunit G
MVLLALCVMRLKPLRNVPSIHDPVAAAKGKRAGRLFGIIFGTESGLIWLCATLLALA